MARPPWPVAMICSGRGRNCSLGQKDRFEKQIEKSQKPFNHWRVVVKVVRDNSTKWSNEFLWRIAFGMRVGMPWSAVNSAKPQPPQDFHPFVLPARVEQRARINLVKCETLQRFFACPIYLGLTQTSINHVKWNDDTKTFLHRTCMHLYT